MALLHKVMSCKAIIMLPITALVAVLVSGCAFIKHDELNQAALAGDQARCAELLGKGANVNGMGMHGMKPIMSAAEGGDFETVKYLISKGADVNAHNNSGSVLMWAIEADEPRIVRLLLMNGADSAWKSPLGQTALDFARDKQATESINLLETALRNASGAQKSSR